MKTGVAVGLLVLALLVASCGRGAMTKPKGLSTSGEARWNFEALLHDRYGNRTVCLADNDFDLTTKCISGAQGYWSYVFPEARHSPYHLTSTPPRFAPPIHWVMVRLGGRFVACDQRGTSYLFLHNDSLDRALDCGLPGG